MSLLILNPICPNSFDDVHLIYRHSTKTVEEVAISGMPLGAMKRFPCRQRGVPLQSGDTILLMTDGFPERMNDNEQMLDYDRAETAFREAAQHSPQKIVDHLVQSCDDWANGRPQDDDVTFVVIKRTN
jgi:serine phosphatase RsbU (regulator of sigma subunit)